MPSSKSTKKSSDSEKKRQDLILKLSRDMIGMGRTLMPEMFKLESPAFHKEIAHELQDVTRRKLNIIAPRDHAKSTIVGGLGVIWHLFFEDVFMGRPHTPKYVVLSSKTQKHAKKLLGTIKHILGREARFRMLMGDYGPETANHWRTESIELKDGSLIEAVGTGQQSRGMKNVYQRPTLIILDDPEDEDNTKTVDAMDNNLDWLFQALEPAIASKTGRIWVIGTPIHQRCMVFILKKRPDWLTMHYQAINEVDGKEVALWEEQHGLEELRAKKASFAAIGRVRIFYQEWQCQIRLDDDAIFREEDVNYYEGHLEWRSGYPFLVIHAMGTPVNGKCPPLDAPMVVPVTVSMGVDPASTTGRTSDYFAIVTIATDGDGRVYVLPYFRKRVDPYDGAQEVVRQYKMYKPAIVRIETTGFQKMLKSYLTRSPEVDVWMPIIEEKPIQKKLGEGSRIEDLQPLWRTNKFFVQPSMRSMLDEFIFYPKPDHDDLMDATYYASTRLLKPGHKKELYDSDKKKVSQKSFDWAVS